MFSDTSKTYEGSTTETTATEVLKLTRVDDCCGCGCMPLHYEDGFGNEYKLTDVQFMIQAGTAVEEGVRQITE